MSFNPLPPPKRGETFSWIMLPTFTRSFNPLPPPKRGETCLWTARSRPCEVSIHSPRRSEGRPTGLRNATEKWSELTKFQSTPPAEARGDRPSRQRATAAPSGVSIHSPRRSEGRQVGMKLEVDTEIVSIHSPRRSEGRPGGFPRQRGTAAPSGVSIHSPRRSEGRPVIAE